MEHLPVEEIARAVSGAVTSVLSKIAEESEGGQPSTSGATSNYGSESEDFQPPRMKKRKQEKGKYVINEVFMQELVVVSLARLPKRVWLARLCKMSLL